MHTRQNLVVGLVLAISMIGISYGAGGVLPGDGLSESTAYLIEDLADFDVFADPCNSATYWSSGVYTKLACDPNLTGRPYITAVIAPDTSTDYGFQGTSFTGVFDGNGHVISNLTIVGNDYLGLFGRIEGFGAEIKNLGIENINITGGIGSEYLGGLCGYNGDWDNPGGTISNCYAAGSITGGDYSDYLGGLCGYNREGTISNCYATGSVIGDDFLGGLCGRNYYGTITNCYATGLVTGDHSLGGLCGTNYGGSSTITNCYATGSVIGGDESRYLGGLCGRNSSTITNCYATSSVTGDDYLGGLCGYNDEGPITNCYATGPVTGGTGSKDIGGLCGKNHEGTITNSYATGSVSGDNYLGGLCGWNDGTITNCYATGSVTGGDNSNSLGGLCGKNEYGTITNCFWDVETSGIGVEGDDNFGATGKTTAQMQMQSTFTDAGWDFTNEIDNGTSEVWQIPTDGGYTVLSSFNGYLPAMLSGNGTQASPYLINDAAQLGAIYHYNINACFRLQSDVDLTGIQWSIAILPAFGGCFDGNGYVIYNLNIEGGGYLGLFGKISGSSAQVKNLGVEDINITGGDNSHYLGSLCGYNYKGTITNCYATGSVAGGDNSPWLGGLCGYNYYGTITNCYATGSVTGDGYLGGLCGYNYYGTITNCYAIGEVIGNGCLGSLCGYNYKGTITNCYATGSATGDHSLGGLCGDNYYGTITNCYATGAVTGDDYLGGLCGHNDNGTITNCRAVGLVTGGDNSYYLGGLCGWNFGTITNCYAIGSVTGGVDSDYLGGLCGQNYSTIINCYATGAVTGGYNSDYLGGLCGYKTSGTISHCFWDVETGGPDNGIGTPKTTAEMQTQSTFTDASWDFTVVPVWHMPFQVVGYPMLGWQRDILGDFTGRYGVDMEDFAVLAETWFLSSGQVGYNDLCDLMDDNTIDLNDLAVFVENWLCD